jgi:hypothetical protein
MTFSADGAAALRQFGMLLFELRDQDGAVAILQECRIHNMLGYAQHFIREFQVWNSGKVAGFGPDLMTVP